MHDVLGLTPDPSTPTVDIVIYIDRTTKGAAAPKGKK
jgi:hypothetical protein